MTAATSLPSPERFTKLRGQVPNYRKQVDGMEPAEAVEYLLWCVEELSPSESAVPIAGLTVRENRLVHALKRAGRNGVAKEALFSAVYFDQLDQPHGRIIDQWVCRVRGKLGPDCITTIWGWGYRWAGSA